MDTEILYASGAGDNEETYVLSDNRIGSETTAVATRHADYARPCGESATERGGKRETERKEEWRTASRRWGRIIAFGTNAQRCRSARIKSRVLDKPSWQGSNRRVHQDWRRIVPPSHGGRWGKAQASWYSSISGLSAERRAPARSPRGSAIIHPVWGR